MQLSDLYLYFIEVVIICDRLLNQIGMIRTVVDDKMHCSASYSGKKATSHK